MFLDQRLLTQGFPDQQTKYYHQARATVSDWLIFCHSCVILRERDSGVHQLVTEVEELQVHQDHNLSV